ncbi:hypothetical protein SUS17_780 [Sphingomonas sp. S17]|nr:hypothetical protein SUS17_780 [Sphingomonas sp. S17]
MSADWGHLLQSAFRSVCIISAGCEVAIHVEQQGAGDQV